MTDEKSKKILVGEDDIDDQDILLEIFSEHYPDYTLQFMTNGNELLHWLSALPPDQMPSLILLDYNMPGLNGAEILKELAQSSQYSSIPKIIWSTSGSDTYKALCLERGAKDYVVKPPSVTGLVEICKYFLSFC